MKKSLLFGLCFSLLSPLFFPASVFACGGLFCDTGPLMVNQAAERIVFAKHGDGYVTAVVQVLYEGESSEFGWIIPVPGVPEVGVSSNLAFTRLQTATNPTFVMNTIVEGSCKEERNNGSFNNGTSANNATANSADPVVAAEGNVGPYDFVVIEVPNPQPDGAMRAVEWLENNGYMAPEGSEVLFQSYLDEGMNLLAFKLTKNADAGDIRPIIMKYQSDKPMIPIKLTGVAANDDMGVLVWVLGNSQAITSNYKSLELNDSLFDWFFLSNYNALVIRAANESGGQGFVTEMSEKTTSLKDVVFSDAEVRSWEEIMNRNYTQGKDLLTDISIFLESLVQNNCFGESCISGVDGLGIALENAFPQASRTEREELTQCLYCTSIVLAPQNFDRVKNAFKDWVVDPLVETQKLLDAEKHFTRFYTTMSAADMTIDPIFEFTTSLEDVSNQHVAERVIHCNKDTYFFDAAWTTTLPSGLTVKGTDNFWPIDVNDPEIAANIVIRDISPSSNSIVENNRLSIIAALESRNRKVSGRKTYDEGRDPDVFGGKEGEKGRSDGVSGGGCSTQGRSTFFFPLFALAFFVSIRRKKKNLV